MSKLDELIEKLCPNGVEYKTLEEVSTFRRGSFPQPYTNSAFYGGEGAMPFVQVADLNEDSFDLKENTKQTISKLAQPMSIFVEKDTILVSIQGSIGKVAITQYDSYVDRTIAIFQNKDFINKRFFAYVLKMKFDLEKKYARGSTLKTITKEEFSKFKVPVPPMDVQCEIVHILDQFTLLTAELTAELTEELTARRKQYDYYREVLLNNCEEYELVKLDDVASHFTGLTYKPSDISREGKGILVLRSSNIQNSRLCFKDNVFVELNNIPDRAIARENDLLICVRNGSKALIGKSALIPKTVNQMAFGAFMTVLRANPDKLYYRYLYHFWNSDENQKMMHGDEAMPINQITNKEFGKIVLKLPSLEKQKEIADILDKLDEYSNDLSQGLSAEIELRKQQYEYYRDKLLSFKELK